MMGLPGTPNHRRVTDSMLWLAGAAAGVSGAGIGSWPWLWYLFAILVAASIAVFLWALNRGDDHDAMLRAQSLKLGRILPAPKDTP